MFWFFSFLVVTVRFVVSQNLHFLCKEKEMICKSVVNKGASGLSIVQYKLRKRVQKGPLHRAALASAILSCDLWVFEVTGVIQQCDASASIMPRKTQQMEAKTSFQTIHAVW